MFSRGRDWAGSVLTSARGTGWSLLAMSVGLLGLSAVAFAGSASAETLTLVCRSSCAFSTVGGAVAAASNGDVIRIRAGSYPGALTISKNVTLRGAGQSVTTIRDVTRQGARPGRACLAAIRSFAGGE